VFVLQVTVDSLGTTNNFGLGSFIGKVLGQQASISVGVITTNDDEAVQVVLVGTVVERVGELFLTFDLVSSATYIIITFLDDVKEEKIYNIFVKLTSPLQVAKIKKSEEDSEMVYLRIISKPPVFLKRLMYSLVISMKLLE
jgi:hypothetical protein